jgi:hypothetical protein
MVAGVPGGDLPVLVVGDVHGDLARLFEALKPYPADRWHTIFLGDLVDYGPFGVGTLRFARDRPNSTVLLGNHEIAMLWALRDPQRVGFWISIGGQDHDLAELARDPSLQEWLRLRPAMQRVPDATLVQHCGNDAYATLLEKGDADPIASINSRVQQLLHNGGEAELWELMSGRNIFATSRERLDGWLEVTASRRVVFGHNPHRGPKPDVMHDGKAINFDGAFSRFHRLFRHLSPPGATVGPLPPPPV